MSAQSTRFARTVLERFSALRYESDREIEAGGGPSASWMTQLRKAAGDVDHLKVFDSADAANRWFAEHDTDGTAFDYPVIR